MPVPTRQPERLMSLRTDRHEGAQTLAARRGSRDRVAMSDESIEHTYAVVVGSGFGGSVAAYRFAEAGRPVVVLERGGAYPPGSFPRTPAGMGRNFWDPGAGLYGMFDVWSFRGLDGIVSSGLGGGSLIYANVLLRKDERWFVHESPLPGGGYEHWPISRSDLDPHYDRAERMLGATTYPYLTDTHKTVALRNSAGRLGLDWRPVPLAISFAGADGRPTVGATVPEQPYGNLHGITRRTCRLCGECDLGCNDGAKNSLDHTYLSAAKHHGADLRTWCEVRRIAPRDGGGYRVWYVRHDPDRPEPHTVSAGQPLHEITCDRLVLAAGTFGTNYLLLRNRDALPGLSDRLGSRFSGNGDLLGFLLNARDETVAGGHRRIEGSRGPVITSAVRVGDDCDEDGSTGRGFYVQDAGYPVFAEWLVEAAQMPGSFRRALRFALTRARGRFSRSGSANMSQLVSALIGPGRLGDGSLPLLGMGRDIPDGVLRLRRGQLDVRWTTKTSAAYLGGVRRIMRMIADDLGACYVDNPLWWARKVVTVHPLGGAPMGRHAGEGVCDPYGEVFGHPGLHVLDGAVLPGPVGANPSLTIAAVADRACDRILDGVGTATTAPASPATGSSSSPPGSAEEQVVQLATGTPVATLVSTENAGQSHPDADADAPVAVAMLVSTDNAALSAGDSALFTDDGVPSTDSPPLSNADAGGMVATVAVRVASGLCFTEEMKGFVATDHTDPVEAARIGQQLDQRLMFHLTITVDDVDSFVVDPEREARAEGYVECALFGGRLPVEQGWFQLFTHDDDPSRRSMRYRLRFRDDTGRALTLVGRKDVHDDFGIDVWRDTSTLYLHIVEGHGGPETDDSSPVLASGVITIHLPDFLRQLTTFRTHGPQGPHALRQFGQLFLGELWDVYGVTFTD